MRELLRFFEAITKIYIVIFKMIRAGVILATIGALGTLIYAYSTQKSEEFIFTTWVVFVPLLLGSFWLLYGYKITTMISRYKRDREEKRSIDTKH